MFFRPLEQVLQKRREATEGAREAAAASLKKASERAAEYEAKLREARAEIYREQAQVRVRWITEQAERVEEARKATHDQVQEAKNQLDQDLAAARVTLSAAAEHLAQEIASSLLERRAS